MDTLRLFEGERNAVTVPQGEPFFRQGEAGDSFYVLLEGEVGIEVDGQLIDRIGPGGIFGEMALISHEARTATAVALVACRAASLDERRFTTLVQQTPRFALHLLQVLAKRLQRMTGSVVGSQSA